MLQYNGFTIAMLSGAFEDAEGTCSIYNIMCYVLFELHNNRYRKRAEIVSKQKKREKVKYSKYSDVK